MAETLEYELNDPPVKTRDELIERLARNRQEIKSGIARFDGIPINGDTVLAQFVRVSGYMLMLVFAYTRFQAYDENQVNSVRR